MIRHCGCRKRCWALRSFISGGCASLGGAATNAESTVVQVKDNVTRSAFDQRARPTDYRSSTFFELKMVTQKWFFRK
jgi:hypothetical protein